MCMSNFKQIIKAILFLTYLEDLVSLKYQLGQASATK